MKKKHQNVSKSIIEDKFWKAYEEKNFDVMSNACTEMAKINDGDSYRLYQEMKKIEPS